MVSLAIMPLTIKQWECIMGAVHDTTGSVADPDLQIRGEGGDGVKKK